MLSLGLRGLTVAVAAMVASPAQPRRQQVLFDVRSAGRNITHAAGGGLNTFCTDPAHGLSHQLSALLSEEDVLPLKLRHYRGCAAFLDELVNARLDRLGVTHRTAVLSDSYGYDGMLCFADDGRTVMNRTFGCLPGGPSDRDLSLWKGTVARVAGTAARRRPDVAFDVWK